MPTYLADDIFECRVEGETASGTRWNNVVHYQLGADSETNMYTVAIDLAVACFTQHRASFSPYVTQEFRWLACRATAIYPQTGVPAVYIAPAPLPGDVTGGSLPPDVAITITKRTEKPGRTFLGRMYMCGVGIADVTDDRLDEVRALALANSAESFLADDITLGTGEVFTPVVASRKLMDELIVAKDAAAAVTQVEVDRVTRNIRNRGLKQRQPVAGQEN